MPTAILAHVEPKAVTFLLTALAVGHGKYPAKPSQISADPVLTRHSLQWQFRRPREELVS
jgi:hypothetical protein